MSKFFEKIEPSDIIAVIVLVGGLVLKFRGFDGLVGTLLTAVVIYYFGDRTISGKIIQRQRKINGVETVEETIIRICKEELVDPAIAIKVAKCESQLNSSAINVNSGGSRDRGIFQINDKYHPEMSDEDCFNIERSTKFFCKAFKAGHLDWWSATKKCWDK